MKLDPSHPLYHHVKNTSPRDARIWMNRYNNLIAGKNFHDFIVTTKPDYITNWHHKLISDDLEDFITNPKRNRLMLCVGPGRGKSEIVSRRLPAYYLGRFPDKRIIAASYGADLAQGMNRDVQRIIDEPKYHAIFPETTLNASHVRTSSKGTYIRTSDKFEIVDKRGYYKSAGVGQGITGMRFDLGIIDDPIKDAKEAQSPRTKQQIWDWYDSTFGTRGAPNNKIILIMTRWAEDDLAGRLLANAAANPDAEQWEVMCFPEEYDSRHPHLHPDDPREEDGEVLWPTFYSKEEVKTKKASSSSKVWASMFQQLPTPDSGTIFEREWFRYYKDLPDIEYKAISLDCSFKDSDSSDYVALGLWGVAGANRYLLDFKKERWNIVATIKALLAFHAKYKGIRYTLIEDKANGPAVISMLKDKIPKIIPYNPRESKIARANAVAPFVEAGNVWLPDPYYGPNRMERPWCVKGTEEVVSEITGFPYAAYDDIVDMFTQFLIREEKTGGWVDEFIKGGGLETKAKSAKLVSELSEMMGWDIE